MGIFSNLFGPSKEQKALESVFEKIRRIIEDEDYQLELLPPELKAALTAGVTCDQLPGATGPFGLVNTNPIPVNGPIGEIAYLSKLLTGDGERIIFHRLGSVSKADVYEAVTISGSKWFIFYLDLYHPRRSRMAPEGFFFSTGVAQFAGFNSVCRNFPYDFIEARANDKTGIGYAYMPMSQVAENIEKRLYRRPMEHEAKLKTILSTLSNRLM